MKLFVDIGNRRVKWATDAAPEPLRAFAYRGEAFEPLWEKAWGGLALSGVWICSVATNEVKQNLNAWVKQRFKFEPVWVASQVRTLDVINGYDFPAQLGPDRWMALLGARGRTKKACCVIDAGTAVTADALSQDGKFLGGVIFPGLALLHESLAKNTAGLNSPLGVAPHAQAKNTADALAAGACFGSAGAVERFVGEHKKVLGGEMEIFLTGGDAQKLKSFLTLPVNVVEDLVLQGIRRVADAV
jgi:type III pantothenate kinase